MHNSLNLYNLLEENPVFPTSTQASCKQEQKDICQVWNIYPL